MRPDEVCLTPLPPHQVLGLSPASARNPCQAPLAPLIPIPPPTLSPIHPSLLSLLLPLPLQPQWASSLLNLCQAAPPGLPLWALWLVTREPR